MNVSRKYTQCNRKSLPLMSYRLQSVAQPEITDFTLVEAMKLTLYLKLFLVSFILNIVTLVQIPLFQTKKLLNLFAKQRVKISCSNTSLHSYSRKCRLGPLIRIHQHAAFKRYPGK